MPTPRFSTILIQLLQKANQEKGDDSSEILIPGDITLVRQDGRLTLLLESGQQVTAAPTTDEAFLQGQRVWVSRLEDGEFIVHGGIR